MAKRTVLVCGFGPGISSSVAERFGREGFAVALVARNEERLAQGVQSLRAKGIEAAAFRTDLSDTDAIRAMVAKVRSELGPVAVLHWNAYAGGAGDLTTSTDAELRAVLDVPVVSLVRTVQEVLPDLRKEKDAAILVTNGGLGLLDAKLDAVATQFNVMGLAIGNAAKHKAVRLLAEKLKAEGIYVGEVMVSGTVKGSAWDQGNGNLDPATVSDLFWRLYTERNALSVPCP